MEACADKWLYLATLLRHTTNISITKNIRIVFLDCFK